jgi:hypothetical protein
MCDKLKIEFPPHTSVYSYIPPVMPTEITQYAINDGYLYVKTNAANYRLIRPHILHTSYESASQLAIDYIALVFSVMFGFIGILAASSAATLIYAIAGFGLPLFIACHISRCRTTNNIAYIEFTATDCDLMTEEAFIAAGQLATDLKEDIYEVRKEPPVCFTDPHARYAEYFTE